MDGDDTKSEITEMGSSEDGGFFNGYGDSIYVIRRTERSIIPNLSKYMLSDEIKNKADVIYNNMKHRVRRGKIRNQLLFYCVYCAHLELGLNVNPSTLGAMFGLNQGDIQRCDSIFSYLQTGYRPPSVKVSPLHLLPDLCKSMDLSEESIQDITKLGNLILEKEPKLYQENPKTVAAGLLRYYTLINGLDDINKVESVGGRSAGTIEAMYDRIARIDNSISV